MDPRSARPAAAGLEPVNLGEGPLSPPKVHPKEEGKEKRSLPPKDKPVDDLKGAERGPSGPKESKLPLMTADQQPSKPKDRPRRFPTISDKPLALFRGPAPTFDRFTFSPLSPQAFPRRIGEDWDTLPARASLLERYLDLQESQSPVLNNATQSPILGKSSQSLPLPPSESIILKSSSFTLAGSGIADALPTPGLPPNLWACLDSSSKRTPTEYSTDGFSTSSSSTYASSSSETTTRFSGQSTASSSRSSISKNSKAKTIVPPTNTQTSSVPVQYSEVPISPPLTNDFGLPSPPPAPTAEGFSSKMPELTVDIGASHFDPPPAPTFDRFPMEFPASPAFSGPAPIDTSRIIEEKDEEVIASLARPEDRFKPVGGGRFTTIDTPIEPPPAPTLNRFPLEFPPSPKRSGPCPIDTSVGPAESTLSSISSDSTTPTQPPAAPTFKDFARPPQLGIKTVRFADLNSPIHKHLTSPTFATHSPSPPVFSPLTPIAMTHAFPLIKSSSPPPPITEPSLEEDKYERDNLPGGRFNEPLQTPRGRRTMRTSSTRTRARTHSPPRSARPEGNDSLVLLPTTVYDPTIVYNQRTNTSTIYPSPLTPEYKSYIVQNVTETDRNRIMQTYFHQARASA